MGTDALHSQLAKDGYVLLPAVFSAAEIENMGVSLATALAAPAALGSLITREGPPHGARNLLRLWPEALTVVRKPAFAAVLHEVLGPQAGLVRGLYFDKPPGATWALPWHRDTAIAVARHEPSSSFRKPTFKAGVPHVEAPDELLRKMLTARIHLDPMTEQNGPLRVLPGSHHSSTEQNPDAERHAVTLHCGAGDVLLMRPLLLHASGHCTAEHRGHRRIVHLEFAPTSELSEGYNWHSFFPIASAVARG
jgi:ectoine hydroxylase-related dioxygenase (phytanoyl-CoA dioxygenase family)